ncbi:GreA/GreB family elongation factor [Paenibacillus sp. y28]|uniref:GreA/GreB family elongation factor n=1 Tax=Paenibacillus sp. y28 TaxID=3129110 RepID=UPI003017C3C1
MNHSFLLQGSRTQLVNQLVYFDEEKMNFLDHYCPGHTRDRLRNEQLLSVYTSTLEQLLADFTAERLNAMVLIGSQVRLHYVEDSFTELFTIVFPHQADPNKNMISFLSPIGHQLLLGRANESYPLLVPSGEITVRIEEIKYMNRGDFKEQYSYG